MFISKKICFIELEKTGISTIKKFLKNHIQEGKITRPHDNVTNEILKKKLFFIGSIRNPLDWYISRWSYGCMMKNDDSMYRNLTKKRLSYSRINNIDKQYIKKIYYFKNQLFKNSNFWSDLYSDPYNSKNFRIWLKSILNSKKKDQLAEHYYFSSFYKKFGYMTFRYLVMFTNPDNRKQLFHNLNKYSDLLDFDKNFNFINYFIKVENLQSDLNELFAKLDLKVTNDIEIVNPSKRNRDINYYYDDECVEIVKRYEKFIFDKYQY